MSCTEIPTELLPPLHEIAKQIDRDLTQAEVAGWSVEIKDGGGTPIGLEDYAAVVRFKRGELDWIAPLIKWLEYSAAVRVAEERRDVPPDPWAV